MRKTSLQTATRLSCWRNKEACTARVSVAREISKCELRRDGVGQGWVKLDVAGQDRAWLLPERDETTRAFQPVFWKDYSAV